ncbi:S-adenosyl-L-methionine-dependent methyltransferase [Xylariales sp. AK1849]|nr:S-adenosyl-L-methionine-dependent methyltransferase [Xylariales sp. AK1849]
MIMSANTATDTSPNLYEKLATCLSYPTDHEHVVAALEHRLQLIEHWGIQPGSRVLEVGCGQGDFTIALAQAVGPKGRVVAVDPAPLDWGTPDYASARAHVLASFLGSRIEFVQADPISFFTAPTTTDQDFDYIVFGYCIWFFSDPSFLTSMLKEAHKHRRAPKVLIVECSLSVSDLAQVPHVLSALADNALESFRGGESRRNIRCALSPRQISEMAKDAGWTLRDESFVTPLPRQIEGQREVRMTTQSPRFKADLEKTVARLPPKVGTMLQTLVDTVVASLDRIEGGLASSSNMDAWVAQFDA